MAVKLKNDYGLKVTPEKAAEAMLVLQSYVQERAALVESGRLTGSTPAVKMMAAIQDFNEEVNDRVKAPGEALYNKIRFTTVPKVFDEEDITKIGVDGVGQCRLQDDISCKVLSTDGLHKWLTDNELEDIIKETVNAQTLAAQIRGRMKENAEVVAKAMKAGTTDPETLQKLQKPLPPAEVMTITPVVRAQLTRE